MRRRLVDVGKGRNAVLYAYEVNFDDVAGSRASPRDRVGPQGGQR
jgi:hypothetical protein